MSARKRAVAIVHERFTELGGSERVVEQLHKIWPEAPIFTTVVDEGALPPGLRDADMRPSPLQRLYRGGRSYAHLLPALPRAIARLEIPPVDLVITSHHAFANRVRPEPGTPIVSYTHTPARWLWERNMRDGEIGGWLGESALQAFAATQRRLDAAAASRLEGVVVNSRHVASRVRRWWGRNSLVVPPPVAIDRFTPDERAPRGDFFLLAGRLVPYKRPELAVAAARRAGVPLVVAGDGRSRAAVEAAAGPDTEILGEVSDGELLELYRRCAALVFPGEEDFGIVPVEAMACGTPVIAFGVGGVLDSVVDGVSGVLLPSTATSDPVDAMALALRAFDAEDFDSATIRRHAERFAPDLFRARFVDALDAILAGS